MTEWLNPGPCENFYKTNLPRFYVTSVVATKLAQPFSYVNK